MFRNNCFLIIAFILFLQLVSCKPTEKGYQAAYDAALGKRQAAIADMDVNLPEGAILQVDGPQLKEINGVNLYLLNERIRMTDEEKRLPGNYNVAVAVYKMPTNARSQANDFVSEGYEAFVASDKDNNFYTIVYSGDNLDEAVKFYDNFKNSAKRTYIGLPDSPILIYSIK